MPALYNMQIITCKLPVCVCVRQYSVAANEKRFQMCAVRPRDITGISPNAVRAHANQKATQRECLKAGKECVHARIRTHARARTEARSFEQPPAVLQQEMYCRQHSCNNKAGPVLEGAAVHDF